MNFLENCLVLAGLPIGIILAGYWLAARLTAATASERLAVAALAGLSVLVWNIATVNFFRPLSGIWVWLCLWPIALTLCRSSTRITLLQDFISVTGNRRGAIAGMSALVFTALLLWPVLSQPSLIFYDGTSNHDAFFWISSAEYLKRHTYMEMPVENPLHPFTNYAGAVVGWRPAWGRMGAEGLLAFTSSIIGLSPLKLYVCATATLILPWIAAVFLAVRTFFTGGLGPIAMFAMIALQPLYVFYHSNANLPNLIGALSAAAMVIATERALRGGPGRGVWLVLLALGLHALLCSYPEMLPFVVLPAGLLWLRTWFKRGPRSAWRDAGAVALASLAGLAINPASTARAIAGFVASFMTARADQNWANLFEPLSGLEYVPALATLSVPAANNLGPVAGAVLTIALFYGIFLALRRATDPLGALFTLTGAGALLAYTLFTDFNYGWQKTVQFGGVFWAALVPVAVIDALALNPPATARFRHLHRAAFISIIGLFGYATITTCLDGYRWSQQKILTRDWFSLREYARHHLRSEPVLVDGASFRMPFFHGMWSSYFLASSEIYFAARGDENGGYLRDSVKHESRDPIPPIAAFLVGRHWADAFDANSPRAFIGDTVALVSQANRVVKWDGFYPNNGVPDKADGNMMLEIRPHSASQLQLTLMPRKRVANFTARWKISVQVERENTFTAEVAGPPPWRFSVPLLADRLNHIELVADKEPSEPSLFPFAVSELKIVNAPK